MRHLLGTACGLLLVSLLPARAEEAIVVELFTSQGCVSCPPADEFFAELSADPRVIPLSLHVDYWDYIGWEDGFADPIYTDRQKAYARAIGSRTIYTPQFIVGGEDRIEGLDATETAHALARQFAVQRKVGLVTERQGEVLKIKADADPALTEPVLVQLVRYKPEETVAIERGENAGKVVTYRNIVTSWDILGEWSGREALDITVPITGTAPAVVIVQQQGPATILAADRVE